MADPGLVDTGIVPLEDSEAEQVLSRAEDLLGRLEEVPGATGDLARTAVAALAQVYTEALARVVHHAAGTEVMRSLTRDELVGHLLALHGVHPDPVELRVTHALDGLRRQLAELGGDMTVTVTGLVDGVAAVVVGGAEGGCGGPSADELADVVRDVVSAAAPELTEVRVRTERVPAAFVPLEAVLRAPTARGAAG